MPLITDPDVLDTMDVFTEIMTPAQAFRRTSVVACLCRMVNLSLEHGNCDASCFAYVWVAMFAGPRFNNYKDGFRFGQLGYELVEKRGLTRYQARIWMNMGSTVLPWAKHPAGGRELVRRAFDAAYRNRRPDFCFVQLGINWSQFVWLWEICSRKCKRNAKTVVYLPCEWVLALSSTSADRNSASS